MRRSNLIQQTDGGLEPIPVALRRAVGYTLDKQSFTFTITLESTSPSCRSVGRTSVPGTNPGRYDPQGDSNPGPPPCYI